MKNIIKALAIVAMFGFVACSGSGESTEATEAPATETPAETPAVEAAPATTDTTAAEAPAETPAAAGETKSN